MNKLKTIAAALMGLGILAAGSANAALYNFTGTVTLCTGTCASIASLDVGTQITGQWDINTTAGGSWAIALAVVSRQSSAARWHHRLVAVTCL